MPDNYDLWREHDHEANKWLARRPVCCVCGEHIQDEHMYIIDNDYFCPECIEDFRADTEDYLAEPELP